MMSEKGWTLVQHHPNYKRIPMESPLCCNTEFAYTTKGREHAQAYEDYLQVPVTTKTEKVETVTNSVLQPFDSTPTLTSETSDNEQDCNLIIEANEETADKKDREVLIDSYKFSHTLTELLQMPDSEDPFMLENLIPEDSITILSGDSDTGKTSWYQQLCLAIIQWNTEFLGLKLQVKHKRALIINTEDSSKSIRGKLKKQLSGIQLPTEVSDRLTVMTLTKDVTPEILTFLSKNSVDLVVIDAFSDVYEGDIRSDNSARKFMNQFIDMIRMYQCTILFVHHVGKRTDSLVANKDNMLGSAAIHGKARSVLMLTKLKSNPYKKKLNIVKGNYVNEEVKTKDIFLEFDPITLLHKVLEDKSLNEEAATQLQQTEKTDAKRRGKTDLKMLEAQKLDKEGMSQVEIAEKIGVHKSTICRWLKYPKPLYDVSEAVK